jgi:hypothetical protein
MADVYDLYLECRRRGLNVKGLSGWTDWQQGYWFRRKGQWSGSGSRSNPPTFFINHHTATSAYTSNVKNSSGQSKANIWLGVDRGNTGSGRMYSDGDGVARADFAVRWAANYGNGACDRTVYERYVWRNLVAPNQPSGGDDGYANKLGVGMEIVHPGDGSLLDPAVWELAAQINAAAMDVYSWSIARILDHRSSTRRKVDIRFAQKQNGYSINALRARIVEIHGGGTTPPPTQPPQEDDVFLPINEGDGMGDKSAKRSDVSVVQRLLNAHPNVIPKLTTDGKYGSATVTAVRQVFSDDHSQSGKSIGGQSYYQLQEVAFGGNGGGGDLEPHTHNLSGKTGSVS